MDKLERYIKLLMGLITGVVLAFLNNSVITNSVLELIGLFNKTANNRVTIFLTEKCLTLLTCFSVAGIIIIIIYSVLILKSIINFKKRS